MIENYRLDTIRKKTRGKKVLDVGCVDHRSANEQGEEWLHRVIREQASELVGLDFEADEVRKLIERGYNIVHGDAEVKDLGQTFDVVVAGELIEHLENPGLFLRNMRKHLVPGGELILTTPNPFYPKRLAEILVGRQAQVNPQHVSWFCPQTLKTMMARTGFVDIEITPFNNSQRMRAAVEALSRFRPWFATNLLACARNPG